MYFVWGWPIVLNQFWSPSQPCVWCHQEELFEAFPASISLKIKGSKLSETLHTCRVLRWSCCSQSLIIACEARTKDFPGRPLKFCLSLSPSLLLLVLFNFPPFFTFFLGPFDWIPLCLDMIWKSSLHALHNSEYKVILPLIYVSEWVTLFKLLSW